MPSLRRFRPYDESVSGRSSQRLASALIPAALLLCGCGPRWKTNETATVAPTAAVPVHTDSTATSASTIATVASTITSTGTPGTTVTTLPEAITTTTAAAAPSTTVNAVAATTATISANWITFFQNTTSIPDRVALLENGPSLQKALEQRAVDPLQQQASAQVVSVALDDATHATVTYNILINGTPALTDAQGTAVLQDGVWKVGADSFCALISLGATAPIPGC